MFFGQSENWRRFGQPEPRAYQPEPRRQSDAERALENTFGRSPVEHGTAPPPPAMEVYTIEVTNPDGSREELELEGPAGMTDSDIEQFMAGQTGGQQQAPQRPGLLPPPPIDTNDIPFLAGFSPNTVFGMARGAAPVLNNAAEIAQDAWNATGGRLTGLTSDSATRANQGQRGGIAGLIMPEGPAGGFEGLANYLPEGNELGRVTGELGATALLTRRAPGGAFGQGAGSGLLLSEGDTWLERGRDAAVGGVTGYLADRIVRGVAGLVNPQVPQAARELHARGVPMTPGQVITPFRRGEEVLRSRPFVGAQIDRQRQLGYEGFNVAALDEVVAPYNAVAPRPVNVPRQAGRASVRSVGDQLSNRYETLIPNLRMVPDQQLAADVAAVAQNLTNGNLSPQAARQFATIVQNQVAPHLAGRTISGEAYRQVERRLGNQIRRFSASQEPDNQAMAQAFEEMQTAFQGALARSNPRYAQELAALNTSWRNLVRVEGAASSARAGIFSPAQFRQAVRMGDSSTRRRATARGEAPMQDLADAADEILPPSYPDSGTSGRSQTSPFDPRFWWGAVQGSMYTPQVQQGIVNAAMGPRPHFAPRVSNMLRSLPAPQAGAYGADALTGPFFGGVPY